MSIFYKGIPCDVIKSKKNPVAYTKDDLVKIAEKKGIKGAKSMKKEDICKELNKLLKAEKSVKTKAKSAKKKSKMIIPIIEQEKIPLEEIIYFGDSPTGMKDMPIEMVSEILKHLSPEDRRKAALASKQFAKAAKSEIVKRYGKKKPKLTITVTPSRIIANIDKMSTGIQASYYNKNLDKLTVGTMGTFEYYDKSGGITYGYNDGEKRFFVVDEVKSSASKIKITIFRLETRGYTLESLAGRKVEDHDKFVTYDYEFKSDTRILKYQGNGLWFEINTFRSYTPASYRRFRLHWDYLQYYSQEYFN